MARVEWTRQSGEEVETVVGMLLCSKFPNAVRVRPSQGDGGIDIFVPGPAGWGKERAVWQIKRYCDNLNGTQKRAIKRSFSRVVETSKKEDWLITEWHLVMPLDLTNQNLGWLDAHTANADFPRATHGLLMCDTLAAEYQNVIDYYLRDGKERLQAAMDHLTRILSVRKDRQENEPLMPSDVMTDLTSIYKALNECDPFYKYSFDVSDKPPPDEPSSYEEGLVAAYAMCQDSVWITIKIFARSLAAVQERPITWRLQLAVPADDEELRQQVEKFIDYGAPLSMPVGTVTGSLDLPAGLGGDLSGASLQVINVIEQSVDDEDTELAIAMLAPDSDTVIASTTIKRTEFSQGQGGVRGIWVDNAKLFTVEMLAKKTAQRELTWNISTEYNLSGRRPADIVEGLKFLAAMHAPNRIGIGLAYGPKQFTSGGPAPRPDHHDNAAKRWSVVAEALARIQNHVSVLLRMPAEMTKDEAIAIIEAAKLLSRETRSGPLTGPFTIIRRETQLEPVVDTIYEFIAIKSLKITLGSDEILVGKQALFFRGKYLDIQDDEFTIEPISDGVSALYTGEAEAGRLFGRPVRAMPLLTPLGEKWPSLRSAALVRIIEKHCGAPQRRMKSQRRYKGKSREFTFAFPDRAEVSGKIVRRVLVEDVGLSPDEARNEVD
ncbi:hypothetical protein [Mycobacterium terramassiliense]|nr:hypothetical protein [Mycobacterium terramassiliense]